MLTIGRTLRELGEEIVLSYNYTKSYIIQEPAYLCSKLHQESEAQCE